MKMSDLGWNPSREVEFADYESEGLVPGRIAEEHRDRYLVFTEQGEQNAEITGKLRFAAKSRLDFPAVGDWVAVSNTNGGSAAVIHAVLPRRSTFVRKAAGETTEPQMVASNVDTVLLVTDMGLDFNVRRLERYLTLAYESGSTPVIVLNKSDLCEDLASRIAEVQAVAFGVPIFAISAERGDGMSELKTVVTPGQTVALIGSSGVGKSTIVNYLLSENRLKTTAVRESDGRGRHTTTARQLILLPSGGMVIDTPGMREIQLWGDETDLAGSFADIEELASRCRFSDCEHQSEPDCAVRAALENGALEDSRWESYRKLKRELRFLERKVDVRARLDEKARWKRIHKSAKEIMRRKYGS